MKNLQNNLTFLGLVLVALVLSSPLALAAGKCRVDSAKFNCTRVITDADGQKLSFCLSEEAVKAGLGFEKILTLRNEGKCAIPRHERCIIAGTEDCALAVISSDGTPISECFSVDQYRLGVTMERARRLRLDGTCASMEEDPNLARRIRYLR
ncbi:MAG: hypothetical protein H7301_13315 [Cryobacterium sp.]|nr:hypothetical protein [Oligoflexia bacterium]